jgi:tungstate transport system substrate-binding protein
MAFAALLSAASASPAGERIICASTTSTQNSGLFEHILPLFEKKTGISVHVIAVGTGAALEMGKRGDADVVLVHARDLELEMVKGGYFTDRHDLMYNDFVILGPPGDPVHAGAEKSAAEVLKKIYINSHPFVSRGDNSGTHRKEMALWREAGLDPAGRWYLEAGQGMARTLRIAGEKRAYALADRGTWLSVKDGLDLGVVFEHDPVLFNQYGVMAVNPSLHGHVNYRDAAAFVKWLLSKEGQGAIGSFRVKCKALFHPNAH